MSTEEKSDELIEQMLSGPQKSDTIDSDIYFPDSVVDSHIHYNLRTISYSSLLTLHSCPRRYELNRLLPAPNDPDFDEDAVVARIRKSTSGIKRLLLNQNVVSGIGNIYADEALWAAQVHGERPGNRVKVADVRRVLTAAREVMIAALAQGGTSFDALYVNVEGDSGYFERSLQAYGRAGEPCSRCGSALVRAQFMNRSSYFCPVCQRRR